jgi:acetylornithine deacetylase
MKEQKLPSEINSDTLSVEAILLLKQLISIPSFSKEEDGTADLLASFLSHKNIPVQRLVNNIWASNKYFDPTKPTLLLNSHHDTVKPNPAYTKNPFEPIVENGKLFGLGSNDAGGCLVALLATFIHYYDKVTMKYNLVIAATAEEEISGHNGLELIYPLLGNIDFAIVGEPTQMHVAVAEKGLLVIDCVAKGKPGHAAREEGENAIYNALRDIAWFNTFEFPRISKHLGKVKMSVTMIQSGTQHNVVPDSCNFTVDIRVTDCYSHEEILDVIKQHVSCEIKARSVRLKSSFINEEHPLVKSAVRLGRKTYGSPTTSDQALLPIPSLKIGPGDSARSHIADEFIHLQEIEEGIELYITILSAIL